MSSDVELRAAWQAHVGTDSDLFDRLLGRHRERHRRYHGVTHVRWVVRHVLELAVVESGGPEPVHDLDAVVAAAFYHDAVYEPQHPANERASARLARRDLVKIARDAKIAQDAKIAWDETRIDAVVAMIEGTTTHLEPPDIDTAVLYDADLAVLGADVAGYDAYVAGTRAEYPHFADHDWQVGRSAVLEGFLERPAIYATTNGRTRWEQRARANITSELARLDA